MSFVTAKVEGFFNSFAPLRLRPRSSVRGPWLTSVFGAVLLIGLPIVIITGLLSFIAYGPQFGQAMPSDVGWLRLPYFQWPTRPSWLYRLTQGLHVGLGLILVPIVLAKLWSVIPKLFVFPPVRTPAQALERWSLIALVGGILFEIITGVLNIQYDYIFGFSFYTAHYWGAWVFIAGFLTHVVIKIPTMVRSLCRRSFRTEMRTSLADTRPEDDDETGLVAEEPAPATISRRGVLALVGGGALLVGVLSVGQTVGGFLRPAALLLPRGRSYGTGPNDFQINRTASAAQITDDQTGDRWRLTVSGSGPPVEFSRTALLAMSQHSASLSHRVCGGMVDDRGLEWGAPARSRRDCWCAAARLGSRVLARTQWPVQHGNAARESGHRSGRAARSSSQRGRSLARSRLSRQDHRSGSARGAQHQMGAVHRVQGGVR